jgi:hypothetical protein
VEPDRLRSEVAEGRPRSMRRLLILLIIFGQAGFAKVPFPPYTVVDCHNSQGITVFPFDGPSFIIPLPFVPMAVAYGARGDVLYALKRRGASPQSGSSIVKIEFHPIRISPLWESSDFRIGAFAVSEREDKLVVAEPRNLATRTCNLVEISLPSGSSRQALRSSDCSAAWNEISLSPDGLHALANVGRDLEMIDLVHGTFKSLGSKFTKGTWSSSAAWSPDGNRIVVMESAGRGKLFLLDPTDLSEVGALHGGSHEMTPVWSPDSRYLVRSKLQLRCGIGIDVDPPFTLEIVDTETGKRSPVRSSICKLQGPSVGWLRSDLVR